jgi:hypothetical protein
MENHEEEEKVFSAFAWIVLIVMFLYGLANLGSPLGLALFSISSAFWVCGIMVFLGWLCGGENNKK